ncbi:MAG: DNA-formamidopyrimidine glycosylase family protein, partial [bacterium]
VILRILVERPFGDAVSGRQFKKVYRHGPFLGFRFDQDYDLVLHPMLAGRLQLLTDTQKPGRGLCLSFCLEDGEVLHYFDNKRMGKVYLIKQGNYKQIPKYLQQGVSILSPGFTLDKFKELIQNRRQQVRIFLMDQSALSAIGNAYADEILFDARVHPKTLCHQLNPEQIGQLYDSIKSVIRWGIDEVEKAQQPIDVKVRGHLRVRNRKHQPCPRCGSTIRTAGVLGHDAFFCPKCQPTKRKQFIEWS